MTDSNRGRPPKYKTPEELQAAIDDYFNGRAWVTINTAQGDYKEFRPTIMGLARAVGLSRQGLLEYSRKDQFSDIVKDAKAVVAEELEKKLYGNAVTGAIFNLKANFGYKESIDFTSSDGSMTPVTKHVYEVVKPKKESQ